MQIKINTSIPVEQALDLVKEVVEQGQISTGRYGKQFCFSSTFRSELIGEIIVEASKTATGAHSFTVYSKSKESGAPDRKKAA